MARKCNATRAKSGLFLLISASVGVPKPLIIFKNEIFRLEFEIYPEFFPDCG